jgi:branched-chain amino acid transport system ATP-binding protein
MLLEVRHLSVSYGGVRAVSDVSFSVGDGQVVTIIGANGAGKSTIMNTISGLVRPSQGEILFRGEEIHALAPHEIVRKGIVHVPEGRGIFGNLTVMENLEVAAVTRPDKRAWGKDLKHVFELFPRLRERLRQRAGTLSGGEQQMLAVARGLVTGGRILLLDEPSMGLAPGLVEEIYEVIRRINREGTTILLVEQNAFKAMLVANEAYVLETGSIVLRGPASELRDNPKVKEAYLGG